VLASCGRIGFQAAPDDDGGDGPLDQIDDSSDGSGVRVVRYVPIDPSRTAR
jgi:hypothetical protein